MAGEVNFARGLGARAASFSPMHGVQVNGQVLGKLVEVGVRGKDSHSVAHGDGANQQVGGGALDALAAAGVVVAGGVFVVFLVREIAFGGAGSRSGVFDLVVKRRAGKFGAQRSSRGILAGDRLQQPDKIEYFR